ncbi:MAG TPA: glycosyltransferase family 2 protein [Cytophagales bacterium]|nr:glycosyltransferase family 2 protein [Cytophagales bacterium]
MIEISVLIVTYNSADVIQNCIESIIAYKRSTIEIVIVDNNSKDNTVEILKTYSKSITLIQNHINVGFSRGMNQAYKRSTGKYVMTFNPDATLYPDTLDKIIGSFENDPKVGLVAGVLFNDEATYILPNRTLTLFDNSVTLHTTAKYLPSIQKNIQKTPLVFTCNWVIGTCMTVRRSILSPEYMYPEKSFLFWEEYDLCNQVTKAEYKIIVNKSVKYKHETGTSFKFDVQKLKMAVRLSNAHKYRVKTEAFGTFLSKLSLAASILDLSAFLLILYFKDIASKSYNSYRKRVLNETSAIIMSDLELLMHGTSHVKKIDQEATLFFNTQRLPHNAQ